MGIKQVLEDHRESVLYIFFGSFTVLISWGTYAAYVWMGIEPVISNALSWVSAILFAFVVNKWLVFECRSTEKITVAKELSSFIGARLFTGIVAFVLFPILLYAGLDGTFFGVEGFRARMVVSFIEIILNWIFSKYLIFTRKTPKT